MLELLSCLQSTRIEIYLVPLEQQLSLGLYNQEIRLMLLALRVGCASIKCLYTSGQVKLYDSLSGILIRRNWIITSVTLSRTRRGSFPPLAR
jgi:hypothetical protein